MESITIEDRKKLSIIGATKMVSSTQNQAIVEVEGKNVIISGNNIEVTKLDLENKQVHFSGAFSGMRYVEKAEKVGLIKRIFK